MNGLRVFVIAFILGCLFMYSYQTHFRDDDILNWADHYHLTYEQAMTIIKNRAHACYITQNDPKANALQLKFMASNRTYIVNCSDIGNASSCKLEAEPVATSSR